MSLFNKVFGDPNEKVIGSLRPIVEKINSLEESFSKLTDEELGRKTVGFKEFISKETQRNEDYEKIQERLDEILPEAFAAVREASKRILGQRHYDVQLIGGIILHRGQIAEMKTGEGKTLVATLPLYLNALVGRGAQLITVNDYLSRVGAGWMAPVYHLLGLSTGVIIHEAAFIYDPAYSDGQNSDERMKHFRPVERWEAYRCDILYGTNNEFGFDYLRDNMAPDAERQVQRELYYCIVDEVDSILIDEARTPLIISAPAEESTDRYYKFAELVERLDENEDFNVDEKMRAATLTESGISKMEKWLGVDNIYTAGGIREVHHIEQALKARVLFKLDRDYVVKDGEVIIVDEFTGRLMHGRRYSDGLHQAIEAKEKVKIQRESQTLATVTFQNYFRMYKKLAGMTGTALTEAEEFSKIYNLETVTIPTNKPMIRKDMNDLIYRTEQGKFRSVIEEVKRRHEKGQPVLVGTISIEKNEVLAEMMEREGLEPQVLNAKNHEKEAYFIANAGKVGAITIATNMAGRGVDIMLGGKEPAKDSVEYEGWKKEHDKVIDLGGLHVIGTERHESRRIDNQLRGRAGRQGDPGSSQFYVSTEDDLMRIFGGDRMKKLMATLKLPEDMPIENRIISRSIESAQRKVEGNNFDIRKHLVEYDDVLNKHREAIYRKRQEILTMSRDGEKQLSEIILEMIENEIEQVVIFHAAGENVADWNLEEIKEVTSTIFPVKADFKEELQRFTSNGDKLDKAKARTAIIEYLGGLAKDNYLKMSEQVRAAGFDWWELERSILVRSIDTLWVEHLDAISNLRQGIGLRGYGQRDPLIEYKKEAYGLYNELNNLIQKEVVYSVFKLGSIYEAAQGTVQESVVDGPNLLARATEFSAPAKEMTRAVGNAQAATSTFAAPKQKAKDEEGEKIGRNDLCPCGSGKKYKKCHGK